MKIRKFTEGDYIYFKHCPFCGSVAVDYDNKAFHCPDCGAVVTFELQKDKEDFICDGPDDSEMMVYCWNRRPVAEITADDLCIMAQKTEMEHTTVYRKEIENKIWEYVVNAAEIGKFECELPKKYANPDFYRKRKFDVTEKTDTFVVSWKKDIKWDYE